VTTYTVQYLSYGDFLYSPWPTHRNYDFTEYAGCEGEKSGQTSISVGVMKHYTLEINNMH
jgi:hypothetical protein